VYQRAAGKAKDRLCLLTLRRWVAVEPILIYRILYSLREVALQLGRCYGDPLRKSTKSRQFSFANEWSASLRALCPPAYLPDATWWSGMRCLDFGADRGPLFDCNVPHAFTQAKMQ
jgi:hypothetical protein